MKKKVPLIFLLSLIYSTFPIISQEKSIFTSQELAQHRNHLISKSFPIEKIKNLSIITTYETLEFSEIYGTELSIDVYSNNNTILPEIKLDNNTISITSSIIKNGKKATTGDICKIEIYVPKDIWMDNLSITYKPEITATESSINKNQNSSKKTFTIPKIKTHNTEIETINADITGKNLTGSIIIKTKDGNITLDSINQDIKQKNHIEEVQLYATSQNGTINLSDFYGNYLSLKTKNHITADNIYTNLFEIKTTEGNVALTLKTAPIATSKIVTKTGSIQLFLPKTPDFTIIATSPRGTFVDKIKNQRKPHPNNITKTYNNGSPEINIESKTGTIELESF